MCVVAENVRKIIDNRGLKQKAVAEKAGYTDQQFSNLLCGRKKIETSDIMKLCKVLEVMPNDLYGLNPDTPTHN